MKNDLPQLLPLMINMEYKKVVIFGGGQVGERKASLFVKYAPTTLISRSFTSKIHDLEKQGLELIRVNTLSDNEIQDYINGAFIVIPATSDRKLNKKIADLAHSNRCLVNSVDGLDDLAVPSIINRGNITLAISTQGASPALSKFIRLKIEETIPDDAEFEDMVRLLKEMREILKTKVTTQKDRASILWDILEDEDVWKALGKSYEVAFDVARKHMELNPC